MKSVKRIIVVLLLFVIVIVVGYLFFTGSRLQEMLEQINTEVNYVAESITY